MKTLIESLFDTDNVTKELPMSLDLIYGETLNALKKFNLEKIDWNDVYSKGYIPQRPSIPSITQSKNFIRAFILPVSSSNSIKRTSSLG